MPTKDDVVLKGQAAGTRTHSDLAFIVHSSETLTNGLPPNVDNKPLARQKRRRTSPEDQLILEQEYKRNPKPDKAARMAIVERVALGEKEVQIWFQNRRQASRRKSRPLELHEYAQYQTLKQQHSSTTNSTPVPSQGAEPTFQVHLQERGEEDAVQHVPQPILSSILTTLGLPQDESSPSQPLVTSASSNYLADRRNEVARSSQESPRSSATTVTSLEPAASTPTTRKELRRVSSQVRLSMSADGNAQIITKDDSSPSPPRQRPSPQGIAAVSTQMSAAGPNRNPGIVTYGMSTPPLARKLNGRSRDSRSWTFFADKNARSELQDKADQETSGSAADAIGILRSTSGRSVLGAMSSKRSPAQGDFRPAKRAKKTPLLQRSQSMQNSQQSPARWKSPKGITSPRRFKRAQSGLGIQIMSADSDKENWSPDRGVGAHDSPDSASEGAAAMQHRSTVTPGKTMLAGIDASVDDGSDSEDDDDEIAQFMSGRRDRKSNSVSEEEELDCVQGLLSLSQGAWK